MLSRSRIVLVERYCQNQIFEGVHFEMQIGGPKRCPFKWTHWFLVSERSELSKNVYIYNSPKNMNERFFLDIATLTNRKNSTTIQHVTNVYMCDRQQEESENSTRARPRMALTRHLVANMTTLRTEHRNRSYKSYGGADICLFIYMPSLMCATFHCI